MWFPSHSDFTTACNLVSTRRAYFSAMGIVTQAGRSYTRAPKQKKQKTTRNKNKQKRAYI